ncbi:MAG: hypothetical protein WC819_05760 [Parcubacteria group bacterium]|jgi:hypothetical protein
MVMTQGDMMAFTRSRALRMVEDLGFKNPSPRYLFWYFTDYCGGYKPSVNFETLAKEIKECGLVARVAEIASLPEGDKTRREVFGLVKKVVDKHRLHKDT